jgi:hypothetical protein
MAKIQKASEDIVNLFNEIREKTSIPRWVRFEVLSNDKQKEIYKISKANDVVEILSGGVNFVVIVNEEILDELPFDMQEMVMNEALAGVVVSDSDTVSLDKPNFNTHRSMLEHYGHEAIIRLHESIKSLYDVKKQKEDEEKARTKKGKKA